MLTAYYNHIRLDALALLPSSFIPQTILDVGCGEGDTAAYLKKRYESAQVIGIEVNSHAAALAREKLDRLIEGSIESTELSLPRNHFDLILCLDVLEHLNDPWRALLRLKKSLSHQGLMLISLPNIQNWRVVMNLLRGRWEYVDSGIMDRTHLRFFTSKSAHKYQRQAGLRILQFQRSMGWEFKVLNIMTCGILSSFWAFHLYFLVGRE